MELNMAIISNRKEQEKEKLKVEIDSSIYKELNDYMKWAKLNNISHCIEDALSFVFKSDRDWKKFKKQNTSENSI